MEDEEDVEEDEDSDEENVEDDEEDTVQTKKEYVALNAFKDLYKHTPLV